MIFIDVEKLSRSCNCSRSIFCIYLFKTFHLVFDNLQFHKDTFVSSIVQKNVSYISLMFVKSAVYKDSTLSNDIQ